MEFEENSFIQEGKTGQKQGTDYGNCWNILQKDKYFKQVKTRENPFKQMKNSE